MTPVRIALFAATSYLATRRATVAAAVSPAGGSADVSVHARLVVSARAVQRTLKYAASAAGGRTWGLGVGVGLGDQRRRSARITSFVPRSTARSVPVTSASLIPRQACRSLLLVAQPRGTVLFSVLAIWGALIVYLVLWITFYVPIWQAGSGGPEQHLSSTAVYVASVIGAILAGFFGNAIGIQRKDPKANARSLRPGATLVRTNPADPPGMAAFATAAFWVYGAVGAFSLLTVLLYQVQSPHEVKALASTFAGIVATLFTAALAPGGGRT